MEVLPVDYLSMFDLTGKKAIVTGGSRGIGKCLAKGLHAYGAEVTIIGISDNVTKAAAEIVADGGQPVHGVKGDLADRSEIGRIFSDCIRLMGTVDILINSAGVSIRGDSETYDMALWDKTIELNLTATFEMCQLAAGVMLAKGKGKIINISSIAYSCGSRRGACYSASKGAVAQLTKSLSNDWAARGINVNSIAPGFTFTDMSGDILNNPEWLNFVIGEIPMRRFAQPDELVGAAVFLASEASSYVTGVTIPVDGGALCQKF